MNELIARPVKVLSCCAFVRLFIILLSCVPQIECSSISDYAVKIVKANKLDHSKDFSELLTSTLLQTLFAQPSYSFCDLLN